MTAEPIHSFPLISVQLRPDGSAHLSVSGRHLDYPPADPAETRAAVTLAAVDMAAELGRAVRMTITDLAATWTLAVHLDGTVADLAPVATKRKRRRAAAAPAVVPTAVASLTVPPEAPAATRPEPPMPAPDEAPPAAQLVFDSLNTLTIHGSALLGRRPLPLEGEAVDSAYPLVDPTRELSKTHARVEWHDGAFWIADRNSANGTTVQTSPGAALELTPWHPYQLHDGDRISMGGLTAAVRLTGRE